MSRLLGQPQSARGSRAAWRCCWYVVWTEFVGTLHLLVFSVVVVVVVWTVSCSPSSSPVFGVVWTQSLHLVVLFSFVCLLVGQS